MNILVVEDDEKLNQIICAYLARSGYAALGCKNPVEAYDLLYAEPCDLIVSDIMMPQVDGFDFAKEIRSKNPHIPILFHHRAGRPCLQTKGLPRRGGRLHGQARRYG